MSTPTSFYLSENTLQVQLNKLDGTPVEDAVGTLVIVKRNGDPLDDEIVEWPQDLTNAGDGLYTYAIPYNLLARDKLYQAQVTFTEPMHHYGVVVFKCVVDKED